MINDIIFGIFEENAVEDMGRLVAMFFTIEEAEGYLELKKRDEGISLLLKEISILKARILLTDFHLGEYN
ncbi:hypothetical protein [Breznakia pachnodae]|uniref:Uncharacterized protein n=1 Tax=Breznakia pachnodae TaxID=265178 RepID=A0ABU0E6P5_9FIRM|nr:hypothetical protein [Breznakia pachnodae]MDQ0362574.1 hypothetical protein [Breznakia pachnodae]